MCVWLQRNARRAHSIYFDLRPEIVSLLLVSDACVFFHHSLWRFSSTTRIRGIKDQNITAFLFFSYWEKERCQDIAVNICFNQHLSNITNVLHVYHHLVATHFLILFHSFVYLYAYTCTNTHVPGFSLWGVRRTTPIEHFFSFSLICRKAFFQRLFTSNVPESCHH